MVTASALLCAAPIGSARASVISSDLAITAHANISANTSAIADATHAAASPPASGNAAQNAVVTWISGGMSASASVDSSLAIRGPLPLGGPLLKLGDGVGITSTMNGYDDGQPATSDGLFGDYSLTLSNHSASHAYQVSLQIDYANSVQASGPAAPPDGAFNIGLITLNRGDTALFFTNLTSDTAFGDKHDVLFTGTSGQNQSDSGVRTVDLTLRPGDTIQLQGQHDLRGGASRTGASYRGGLKAFISLAAVSDLSGGVSATPAASKPADTGHSSLMRPIVWDLLVLCVIAVLVLLRRRRK